MTNPSTPNSTTPSPGALPPRSRYELRPMLVVSLALALLLGGIITVCGGQRAIIVKFFFVIFGERFGEGVAALAWFVAAMGWGWAVRRLLVPEMTRGLIVQTAIGAAVLLLGAWLLAWAGFLNPTTAWLAMGFGWLLLIHQGQDHRETFTRPETWPALPEITMTAAPATALLFGAATVAPGILWESEANGYDVLSYHLQLPREWIDAGGMIPLHHNVYSYLPNPVESTFMLLGTRAGSIHAAALASQLVHAGFALLAAVLITHVVTRLIRQADPTMPTHGGFAPVAGALAGAIYLAAPWTIVTGSMAYNEQAAVALAAAALVIIVERRWPVGLRTGAAAGFLCGMSFMCKPSTMFAPAVFVAALVLLAHVPRKALWRWIGAFAIMGVIPIALWMIRNTIWCGNPTFPMLTDLFGTAHWTSEQAARWNAAHNPALSLAQRLTRLWTMGAAHAQFGYALWPLAVIAAAITMISRPHRRCAAAMIIMIAALGLWWMFATHLQSRFLIPLLVPACVLIGLGVHAVKPRAISVVIASLLVIGLSCGGYYLYLTAEEPPESHIGGVHDMSYWHYPYRRLNDRPPYSKIYAEGFATPFYATRPMPVPNQPGRGYNVPLTYHTVWDRSLIGPHLDAADGLPAHKWMATNGYTHLLIDWHMLQRWMSRDNYGYDPNVSIPRLKSLMQQSLVVRDWGSLILCELVRPVIIQN